MRRCGDAEMRRCGDADAANWTLARGLKPKWVDVDHKTANINIQDLKYKLSPSTKVMLSCLFCTSASS